MVTYFLWDGLDALDTRNRYHLILLEKGELTLQVGGKSILFLAPCLVALNENRKVEIISANQVVAQVVGFHVRFLNVHITFDQINNGVYEKNYEQYGFVPLTIFYYGLKHSCEYIPLDRDDCHKLHSEYQKLRASYLNKHEKRWSCWTRLHLNLILEMTNQLYLQRESRNHAVLNLKDPESWVEDILHCIHKNYHKNISLSSLEKDFHINSSTLGHYFRKITGFSVTDYIIRYRLQCAGYALATTELCLEDIAQSCGFFSASYMIRQFRAKWGCTPSQYRKEMRKKRQENYERNNTP